MPKGVYARVPRLLSLLFEERVCYKCKLAKPLSEFENNRNIGSGGKQYRCRSCAHITRKQYGQLTRMQACLLVGRGKLECICGCGCTDIRFLDINHKNGGLGRNRSKKESGTRFFLRYYLWRSFHRRPRTNLCSLQSWRSRTHVKV